MCFFKKHYEKKDILYRINSMLEKINDSIANHKTSVNAEENNYTKEYNLTYITLTYSLLFGSFLGIIVLYVYLKNINSITLLNQSIASINTIWFIVIFLFMNSFVFLVSYAPTYLIIKNNIKERLWIYSIPAFTPFLYIIVFGISIFLKAEDSFIRNQSIILSAILLLLLLITFFSIRDKSHCKNGHISDCFEIVIYFILSSFYSFLFVLGYNLGEHDFFYIIYSISLPILVILHSYLTSKINAKDIKTLFQSGLLLFITSTILLPFFIFSLTQIINQLGLMKLETIYSDKIMQVFGLQDKKEKIYYIEENFIKTNIESKELIINVRKQKFNLQIEDNKYRAFCGKIYWNTGNVIVFKNYDSDNFIQIPAQKIFEYQGDSFNCNLVKAKDTQARISKIIIDYPLSFLQGKIIK